jgi:hypothetical protein
VLVRMTMDGRKLETARIGNSPASLRAVMARAGERPLVVLEATYGWYWAADVLEAAGAEVRLAHPLGVKAFSCRRVKNDERGVGLRRYTPNPDGNSARRDVAQLHVPRLLPYRYDNHHEYGQGDPARGKDNQDQPGEHQFSALLPMICSSDVIHARSRACVNSPRAWPVALRRLEFLHSTRFALVDEQDSCMQNAPECQDLVTMSQDQV